MTGLLILAGGYPAFLAAFVLVDKFTGWQIAEAFGKEAPGTR